MMRRHGFELVAGLACLFWATGAIAAPRWVRVSPTVDPAHTMFVSWDTDTSTESRVQYGPDVNYGLEATGTEEDAGGDLGWVHSVELTDLTPGSTYHYRVGNPSDGWSGDHTLVTAPADVCAPFSFGVAADNRGNFAGTSTCWAAVFEQIVNQGVDFVINSGDLVMEGKNDNEWADFLVTSEPWMGEVAILPAIGNHDDDDVDGDGALYNRIFALPRNSVTNTEDFFSFDYGNVHFVCLSTSSYDFATQSAWLEQDLSATDRMWKVVYFHVPVYSSGSHGSNEDDKTFGYVPIFDAHHVDLVITGHDHIYERYKPMNNHQEVATYDDGTCYMVSGGGGAATDPIYWFRPKEDGLAVGDALHHYVAITISNNVMHVRAERVSGTGCLQGGQGVIDEFDIVKTLADDPCVGPTDADGDGFSPPNDCDDGDASVHPGAEEVCGDGVDQNCDGADLDCPCEDADGDGYGAEACGGADCDDSDPAVKPGAIEACGNGVDDDCDGETDEADCQLCTDADSDGYPAADANCPAGDDCDDGNAQVYPGANEWCNQVDDNCDGQTDEGDACASCADADGDGHEGHNQEACPGGTDCDDGDPAVNPDATEICNAIDDDCDGLTDEDDACGGNCTDADMDGYYIASAGCPAGDDCDDTDGAIHPGAEEACDLVDQDCDGLTDEDLGSTRCGTGACLAEVPNCLDGQLLECHPGLPHETPESTCDDGIDNDCNGYTDAEDPNCRSASGCGCATSRSGLPSGLVALIGLFAWMIRRRKDG